MFSLQKKLIKNCGDWFRWFTRCPESWFTTDSKISRIIITFVFDVAESLRVNILRHNKKICKHCYTLQKHLSEISSPRNVVESHFAKSIHIRKHYFCIFFLRNRETCSRADNRFDRSLWRVVRPTMAQSTVNLKTKHLARLARTRLTWLTDNDAAAWKRRDESCESLDVTFVSLGHYHVKYSCQFLNYSSVSRLILTHISQAACISLWHLFLSSSTLIHDRKLCISFSFFAFDKVNLLGLMLDLKRTVADIIVWRDIWKFSHPQHVSCCCRHDKIRWQQKFQI